MKIYLVGSSGFPNYGDELILRNWVVYLTQKYPTAEIWLDVPFPTIIHSYFSQGNIKVTNALWRLIGDNYSEDWQDFYHKLESKICFLGSPSYDLSLKELMDIDFFHIIGGGYINHLWSHHIGLVYIADIIKRLYHAKIYATGMGLLPLVRNGTQYDYAFRNFDYCEVRDKESASFSKISLGYDDAYLNLIEQKGDYPSDRVPDVIVCLQSDTIEQGLFDLAISQLRERLLTHHAQGLSIGYVEAIPGQDKIAFDFIKDLVGDCMFFSAAEVILHGLPIQDNQIWYSSRFHHHLIASLYGLSGVAINMKPNYYDIKHGSLLDNGTGWAMWNVLSETIPEASVNVYFSEKSLQIIQEKRLVAERLYPLNSSIPPNDNSHLST